MLTDRIKLAGDEIAKERESFENRAMERLFDKARAPRLYDVMEEYYLPLTTFGAKGIISPRCNNKYYFYRKHLNHLKEFAGKRVLNVACGTGELCLYLAHIGLEVDAFDYAESAVEYARELVRINGVDDRVRIDCRDVRYLEYEPATFDLITGESALHHLIKYENSMENLYRVLKPGGTVLFWDNFANDPLVQSLRPLHWYLRGWEGEYSLRREDIDYLERVFDKVIISDRKVIYTYSRFFAKPTAQNRRIAAFLERLDARALEAFPFLKRFFSLAYLEMHKKPC